VSTNASRFWIVCIEIIQLSCREPAEEGVMKSLSSFIVLIGLFASSPVVLSQEKPADGGPDRAALEAQFARRLTNSRLSGSYVSEGRQGPPQHDQYILRKVEKAEGDKWVFTAVIEYGNRSVALPLEVPVLWAGDTPVICVTNMTIPGLGTYTARVMFYGDHYAGTWSSATHGGYMWGRIEPIEKEATSRSSQPATKRNSP
jgi:hypothetical protein